ncbi:hypothetical protein HOC37_04550 [bacterium]|jgi:hypothetical protein|nr:hypothetical protein [bacterium]MBT4552234.1 hypothetical protein [bacterium]MBT5988859.1 hypothetical protein [bacterium]
MINTKCEATINRANSAITISGLGDDIVLKYVDDIDFTALIERLTKAIDDDKSITLTCSETEDEKEKLILNTLKDIFDEYNNCLKTELNTEAILFQN